MLIRTEIRVARSRAGPGFAFGSSPVCLDMCGILGNRVRRVSVPKEPMMMTTTRRVLWCGECNAVATSLEEYSEDHDLGIWQE